MNFDPATFRLNSPLGKRILATSRGGNHAHPGEEEAIVQTLAPFAADPAARWLDAGCGRGGTAAFVAGHGWARVTAFDIDAISIGEARVAYPAVRFHACGVLDAPATVPGPFDLIYLFNAFYAFPDQPAALRALRALAADAAPLVLFDYVDRGGWRDTPAARRAESGHWRPIDSTRLPAHLASAGWTLETARSLDADYARWYRALLTRIDTRREALEAIAPPAAIDYTRAFFQDVLAAIEAGALGGAIFQARATPRHSP